MTALAQLDRSHRRHDERLEGLIGAAVRLADGVGGMTDVEEAIDVAAFLGRAVPRHFGDEDEVVFPALAAAVPATAAALTALTAEHPALLDEFAALAAQVAAWDEQVPDAATAAGFVTATRAAVARYRDHAAREDALFAAHGDALAERDAELLAALDGRRGGGGGRRR